jgi:16S rRNA (guanine1516-N2)-methyltransferase
MTFQAPHIDFNQMDFQWQHRSIGVNHDLAKAIGVKKLDYPHVLDATAGLARDAFILAKLGCKVTMLERHELLAAQLQIAVTQCESDELKSRLTFIASDSRDYLKNLEEKYEVIYVDPMFPEKNKSALVKKDMQTLQQLVGKDEDADELFELALSKAIKRVVVKRHRHAPLINNQKPSHSITGKSTRYDVYSIC